MILYFDLIYLLEIYLNGNIEDMQLLGNWINTRNEISIDCEKYPD